MTPFTLSSTTIAAINTALAGGVNGTPGTDNINFVTAYQDIYNDIAAQNAGGNTVDSGTLQWFQQAYLVDEEQWVTSAQGDFIWAYTKAAAASEGATITNTDLQNASNAIALAVFNQLKNASYVFTDANIPNGFGTLQIIADDAGAGLNVIKAAYSSARLDDAIWGGTLFARTELEDSTYFSDYGLTVVPGTRDANAILAGLFAGAEATLADGYTATSTGLSNVFNGNMDRAAVNSVLSGEVATVSTWSFAATGSTLLGLGSLAAGVNYIWNTVSGGLVTLNTSDTSAAGVAYAYEPDNDSILTFDQGSAGTGTLTLPDGTVLSVGGTADLSLADISGGSDAPEQDLLSYLSDIGDSTTASALTTADFDYQNPTGTAYTLNPTSTTIVGSTADVLFEPGPLDGSPITPGAVIDGPSTVTSGGTVYDAYNTLEVGGDISQDTISNIQEMIVTVPTSMTAAQFNSFSKILGALPDPSIEITTAGTVSLNAVSIVGDTPELDAESWGGTTLIANNTAGVTLVASLYGNDTLEAGTGGDYLDAGEGVDTLEGGSGNDVFGVDADVAGTTITGGGGSDVLAVGDDDISQISVTGVQTLDDYSDLPTLGLDASELSVFTTLVDEESSSGTITLDASSAGTYSLAGKTLTGHFNLDASQTVGDVTLVGGANAQILSGGAGNDTFTPGGESETLDGGSGNDTFDISSTLGNISATTINGGGGSNTISSSNGDLSVLNISNVQTLQTNGANTKLTASEFGEFSDYDNTSSTVAGTLQAANTGTYDLATETVTGNFNLDASLASGTVTLIGNNQAGQTLTAGSGTDTLTAGTGGDSLYDGSGVDTLTGGTGNDTFYISNATAGTSVTGGGGSDTLDAETSDIGGISISGMQTLELGYYLSLTASQFSGFSDIDAVDGATSMAMDTSGTYNLSSKSVTGSVNLSATYASGDVTLIGNNQADQDLTGGDYTDTLEAGNGTGDILYAGQGTETLDGGSGSDIFSLGSGVDTVTGGSGYNWLSANDVNLASGDTLNGGSSGGNTLQALGTDINISGATLSNIQGLDVEGGVTLTASQLAEFGHLSTSGSDATIYAAAAGTYDLASETVTGNFSLVASLTGNDTLIADNDGESLTDGAGVDTLEGGTGNDTFIIDYGTSGASVSGGGGSNTLFAEYGDLSNLTISGVQTLETAIPTETITLTASQFSALSDFVNDGSGTATIDVIGTGTYSMSGKTVTGSFNVDTVSSDGGGTLNVDGTATSLTSSAFNGYSTIDNTSTTTAATIEAANVGIYNLATKTVTGDFNLDASGTSANVMLTGNNQAGQTLTAGSGTDTLTAGTGGDSLYDGSGVDTLTGGTGNDTFYISNGTAGTSVTGGGGSDTLVAQTGDIGAISISGIQTLDMGYYLSLTASQFSGFSDFDAVDGVTTMAMDTAGTYDLTSKSVTGSVNLSAAYASGNVTLIGNNQNSQTLTGGPGSDTLEAGDGSGDSLTAGLGNTTLIASTGSDTLTGDGGTNTYEFGSSFGTDAIEAAGASGAAGGEVAFTSSGTTDEKLWFQQSGNNLVIDLLDTSDQITIDNWYSSAANRVSSFTADGLTLDTQLSSLVSAMATYAAAHSGFDPTTATSMPTDTTLQSAIAASWHS